MDHNRSTAHSLSHNHHGHHGPSSRLTNASNSVTHGHNVLNDRRELASDSIYSLLENSHIVATEKVQSLAGRIYQEFERMISRYDEEVVKSLMPLVVNVLENLDSAYQTIREHDVELELLRDDNEQLVAQYEREKSARKSCEQRLLEIEDIYETEKKELLAKQESLESIVRMLELKHKNSLEHASRLEDREIDNKKEYQKLHDRYTDLFKTHLEYVDRTKFLISSSQQQFAASTGQTTAMSASVGSERMTAMMAGSGGNNVTVSTVGGRNQNGANAAADTGYNMPRSSGPVSFGFSSLEATSDGIDDSLTTSSPLNRSSSSSTTSIGTPAIQLDRAMNEQNSRKNRRKAADGASSSGRRRPMRSESEDDDDDEDAETPHVSPVEELRTVADSLADANKTAAVSETASSGSVIDSTHAKKEERIGNNLYQEFSFQDMEPVQRELEETPDVTGNWVNAGEYASSINDNFFTMGKEVEKLIAENNELLETKNALNVVKNDLITQVDELQSKLDLMQRENDSLSEMKLGLLKRINQLEDSVKKQKEQMDASKEEDEEGASNANGYMAHKKRFTRVEMARVLMERNQYKEKLMELQDSVRWSEYARVSKYSNLDKNKAKTSSFWTIFSKLFTSGSGGGDNSSSTAVAVMTSSGGGGTGVSGTHSHPNLSLLSSSLRFNANSNHLIPEITATPLAISSSTSINTEVDEIGSSRLNTNRYRAPKRYDDQRNVQFCDNDDEHRFETSGWRFSPKSIPDVTSPASVGQSMLANSRISVPLPIHCQPIQEHNNNLHLWCGAGVNLFGGFTYDGEQQKAVIINDGDNQDAAAVASSDSNSSTKSVEVGANARSTNDSEIFPQVNDESVRELDTEIEALRTFTNLEMKLSSYVWLCMTSKHLSRVTIINANSPNDVLGNFAVCNDHLLCIGSVPGVTPHEISDVSAAHGSIANNLPKLPDNAKDYLLNQLYVVETNFLSEPIKKSDDQNAESAENVEERGAESGSGDDELNRNSQRSRLVKTVLATMWMGSQNHSLYIHSSIDKPEECIASFKLPDSIVSIVHVSGKVVIALANGTVAIFGRQKDGQWDLSRYFVLVLGPPIKSVRCLTVVGSNVWCSCRNRIFVLNPKSMKIVHSFVAEPREELDVRLMTWYADGVWVSTRLSSVLKLFHAFDYSLLQTFSIEPYVNKMLGPGKFGFSFIKVTALLVSAGRLWIGTCYGVILSVPLNDHSAVIHNMTSSGNGAAPPRANFNVLPTSASTNSGSSSAGSGSSNSEQRNTPVSKCCTTKTQVSLHGHRDDVKFFVTVPGCGGMSAASTPADAQNKPLTPMSRPTQLPPAMLVLCGGKGYIDFRADDKLEYQDQVPHLLMWQVATV